MDGVRHSRTAQKVLLITVAAASLLILVSAIIIGSYMNNRLTSNEVIIGETKVAVKVADDVAERKQGLSGTKPLKPDTGMLFIFDELERQGIWMKDMKYPLDIIWLDDDKKVVHTEENVAPDTYPETFASTTPALYVLEVPSGFVAANHIKEGAVAAFSR